MYPRPRGQTVFSQPYVHTYAPSSDVSQGVRVTATFPHTSKRRNVVQVWNNRRVWKPCTCVCVCVEFGRSESIKALEKLILLRTRAHTHAHTYINIYIERERGARCGPRTRMRTRARTVATCFIIEWPPSRTANQLGNWFIIISLCFHYPG